MESDDGGTAGGDMVPKARLDSALAKLARYEQELEAARGELEQARSQLTEGSSQLSAIEQQLAAEREGRAEDLAIAQAGLTDLELVRFEHQRHGGDRPLTEWIEALRADPSRAPLSLRVMLGQPQGQGQSQTQPGEGEGQPQSQTQPGEGEGQPQSQTQPGEGEDVNGASQQRGTVGRSTGVGEDHGPDATSTRSPNEAIRAIPYRRGSREWLAEASRILRADVPSS